MPNLHPISSILQLRLGPPSTLYTRQVLSNSVRSQTTQFLLFFVQISFQCLEDVICHVNIVLEGMTRTPRRDEQKIS